MQKVLTHMGHQNIIIFSITIANIIIIKHRYELSRKIKIDNISEDKHPFIKQEISELNVKLYI